MQSIHFKLAKTVFLAYIGLMSGLLLADEKQSNDNELLVKLISFKLTTDNNPFDFPLDRAKISEQVSQNLAQWQYPVKLNQKNYSHTLEARLDKISHQQTPIGFSFSSGNSDPRSADFQKADVLPITCRLSDNTGKIMAEQQSTFSNHQLSSEQGEPKQTEQLINQISTACFNLLADHHIAKVVDDTNKSTVSTWHPQIRIQTIEPEKVKNNPQTGEVSVIEEAKKQVIIENQGSPVIFQLGHERR